jgi:hypothetical protein
MVTDILTVIADPVLPTSKVGNAAYSIYVQYGLIAVVCLIVALFVMKAFQMLMKHPVIFVIIVLIGLLAVGAIKVGVK